MHFESFYLHHFQKEVEGQSWKYLPDIEISSSKMDSTSQTGLKSRKWLPVPYSTWEPELHQAPFPNCFHP